jgi:NADPH2:quinone reductase
MNGDTMKALMCNSHGLPDTLQFQEVPDPSAGPGQVVVEMKAAGVNFPDVLIIQNKYQFKPDLPFAPGAELAGIVLEVGEGVQHVKAGDAVIASVGHGAFAQRVLCDARRIIPIPQGVSFELAAAFVLAYGTSWHALKDRAQLQAGETLLVLGAAGGVGLAAIEIGKALGARVIAAASTAKKLDVCVKAGADATINYSTEDLRSRIKDLTEGKGPQVIYDPVGGHYAGPAFRSIAWRGRYLVVGFANGEIPKLPLNLALLKGADIRGVFWGDYTNREPKAFAGDLRDMFGLVAQGKLKPHISGRYPLAQGAQALNDMMSRKVTGKVIITNP